MEVKDVINFWFKELTAKDWFSKSPKIDQEIKHRLILEEFGRYPHCNRLLGRKSTKAEVEFLKGPNSSF